jgi:hypothetical protein
LIPFRGQNRPMRIESMSYDENVIDHDSISTKRAIDFDCDVCEMPADILYHIDSNIFNYDSENIVCLCRKHFKVFRVTER